MVTMDYLKSTPQLARERQAERQVEQQARMQQPNIAPTAAPQVAMRMGGMRMPTRTDKPTPTHTNSAKPQIHEASYIRGGRMSMTPPDGDNRARTLMHSKPTPDPIDVVHGFRHPAQQISEPGIASYAAWRKS